MLQNCPATISHHRQSWPAQVWFLTERTAHILCPALPDWPISEPRALEVVLAEDSTGRTVARFEAIQMQPRSEAGYQVALHPRGRLRRIANP